MPFIAYARTYLHRDTKLGVSFNVFERESSDACVPRDPSSSMNIPMLIKIIRHKCECAKIRSLGEKRKLKENWTRTYGDCNVIHSRNSECTSIYFALNRL